MTRTAPVLTYRTTSRDVSPALRRVEYGGTPTLTLHTLTIRANGQEIGVAEVVEAREVNWIGTAKETTRQAWNVRLDFMGESTAFQAHGRATRHEVLAGVRAWVERVADRVGERAASTQPVTH